MLFTFDSQGSLPVAAGGCLQLVAADISQRQTLSPDMFDGVRSVISCTAVKVQPKEGDTADRAKYYQVWYHECIYLLDTAYNVTADMSGSAVCHQLHCSQRAAYGGGHS